ncbi:MAG: hypothetical protein WBD29_09920, partial [Candidatus Competibacter sp.]
IKWPSKSGLLYHSFFNRDLMKTPRSDRPGKPGETRTTGAERLIPPSENARANRIEAEGWFYRRTCVEVKRWFETASLWGQFLAIRDIC